MNINRHNYEEFFILYMDNELGMEERRQVEHFVQNHPDLKEELEGLLHYKLTPDMEVVFPGKDELLKGMGQSAVNLTNYKEWLLLYIDDELSITEKAAVEQFIAGNDVAKKELSLLERTKLQPELVSFAVKKSLYRREERRIPIALWRAAAAIIVLALGVTVLLLVTKKSGPSDEIVNTNPAKENNTTEKIVPVQPGKNPDDVIAKEQKNDPSVVVEKENQVPRPVPEKDKNNMATNRPAVNPKNKLPDNVIVPVQKEEKPAVVITNEKPSNNLPQPLNNPNLNNTIPKNSIVVNENNIKDNIIPKTSLTNPLVTSNNGEPSDIRTASVKTTADGFEDNGKKNKLRGFFRKITRTFEKRTNIDATTDDNKLLVAGLSINLK